MSSKGRKNRVVAKVCALAVLAAAGGPAWGQLRIVTMNSANSDPATPGPRSGMATILQAINGTVSDDPTMAGSTGIAKPIDVLAIQESNGWATTGVQFANLLNSLVPGANYQVAHLDGGSTGSGTQSLVYNANTLTLVGTALVGVADTSGQPRQTTRFQLRPVGYGADADIYIYNAHMKSATGSANVARRLVEANAIRANADALPAGSNIIYLGDFNVYNGNTDDAFQRMISAGNGQGIDPISAVGNWSSNSSYHAIHTQSPYNKATATALGTGFNGTGGGMDDRFDFQLVSANLNDGHGVAYIPNSYQAFGNDGSMAWGSGGNAINQGGNTAQPQNVLDAMASILDHVPVVADYQLPARMSVTVSAAPERVIAGTAASLTVGVSNSAPVSFANGADVLAYALSSGGALSGSGSGSKVALAAATNHTVTLSTAVVGPKSGTISVTSSSQQVANGAFSQGVNYTVVDHATPSFVAAVESTNETIDFGYVPQGFASRTATFQVANLAAASGYTADLAVTSVVSGGSGSFGTDVGAFGHLAAGGANTYTATLSTGTAGALTGMQTIATSDEAIPGAAARTPLVLTMNARVLGSATFPASGSMRILPGEVYDTGPFSLGAGVSLAVTGGGTTNVTGPQSNGAGSQVALLAGAMNLSTDAGGAGSFPTTVVVGGTVPPATLTMGSSQHLASLAVQGAGDVAVLSAGGDKVLSVRGLSVGSGGTLDLNDNWAVVDYDGPTVVAGIVAALRSGYAGGGWDGPGIVSTAAANSVAKVKGIGYAEASVLLGLSGSATGTWAGETVDATAVLMGYASFGDANMDGTIDGDDYALVDMGMAGQLAGWVYGDFDYSGAVDAADYLLMDEAYGRQAGDGLSPGMLADRASRFGEAYVSELVASVPEPAVSVAALAVPAFMMRRRSRAVRS